MKGEISMPIISIKISKRSTEMKKELIKKLTEAASEVTKIPVQAFTVLIDEYEDENLGIGGVNFAEHKLKLK